VLGNMENFTWGGIDFMFEGIFQPMHLLCGFFLVVVMPCVFFGSTWVVRRMWR
jgi:hypothetical protein